jgi:hypothetical protein
MPAKNQETTTMKSLPWLLLPTLLLPLGCGSGALGNAVRGREKSVNEARGGEGAPTCGEAPKYGAPLVVDWPSEQRGDLEVAMKQGVGVVAYDCKGVRMLPSCKVRGGYGFMGISLKKETIELKTADELAANLPLGATKLGASLSSSSSIAVDLRMIGVNATTRTRLTRPELTGDCAEATHFVQTATVGAFAVLQKTEGAVAASVSAPIGDVSGSSSSDKSRLTGDGELESCEKWNPDSERPPAACKAVLRLQLTPIASDDIVLPDDKAGAFRGAVCQEGFSFSGGKCTPSAGKGKQCDPTSEEDCERQCKLGHAPSCTALGRIFREGIGKAKQSFRRSVEPLTTACEAPEPDPKACLLLARTYDEARREIPYDESRVRTVARKASWLLQGACGDGDAEACWLAGDLFRTGVTLPRDPVTAMPLLEQACNDGYARACFDLVQELSYAEQEAQAKKKDSPGEGGPQEPEVNPAKGTESSARKDALLRRSCNGGFGEACFVLATGGKGSAFQVDTSKEEWLDEKMEFMQRACESEFSPACRQIASYLAPRDKERSRQFLERWKDMINKRCEGGMPEACEAIGLRYSEGGSGLQVDPKIAASGYERWRKILDQRCTNENAEACQTLALAHRSGFNQTPKDPKLVKEYTDRSHRAQARLCSGDNTSGCLGLAYELMSSPDFDGYAVHGHLSRACNKDNVTACYELGRLYEKGQQAPFEDDAMGIELWWGRACSMNYPTACASLGRVYEQGKKLPKDEKKAFLLQEHACKSSRFESYLCSDYERMLSEGKGTTRDEARYFRHIKARCEQSRYDVTGCIRLSQLHEQGIGVKADKKQAQAIFDARVCHDGSSCNLAAQVFERGRMGKKDPGRAVELYKKSCGFGQGHDFAFSCMMAARILSDKKSGVTDLKAAAELAQRVCERTRDRFYCKDAEALGAKGLAAIPDPLPANPYKK